MAVHDYVIANGTGQAVRQDLNNALAAIVSNNSSSSAPGTTYAYQWWADTNTNTLKIRNSANNGWITLRELDGTMLMEDGSAASPGLSFASDTSTGIFRSSTNRINFATNGVERLELANTTTTFNEDGNDINFRVETSGNANMLFVDGGEDRVGIGTSSPSALFDCELGTTGTIAQFRGADTDILNIDGDSNQITLDSRNVGALAFEMQGSEAMRIDSSGRLLVGTSSTSVTTTQILQGNSGAASGNGKLIFARGTTSPANGAGLGEIAFSDSSHDSSVTILAARDGGTWTSGSSQPSRIVFSTTANGASSPTERMRIDSSGNLIQYSTGTLNRQHRQQSSSVYTATNIRSVISGATGHLAFDTNTNWTNGNAVERMRIASSGYVEIGNTQDTNSYLLVNTDNNQNAVFNRTSNDGDLVLFRQDGTTEGTINVSGTTVGYNGGHLSRWSQLAAGAERTEILRGSVLSNLDEMCEWAYEAQDAVLYTEEDDLPEGVSVGDIKTPARDAGTENNEQLNRMKVSDVEGDVNVSGVFQSWDDDDDTYTNDFYCAMTGDFVIRVAQGTTVARGDLLMSAGDGTAKPQDDDIVRSKTIAKVTSTTVSTTYSDGSYCVPCVLMAC